jgi:hypothetical protein
VEEGKGKMVRNFKYRSGGSQPKQIWLTASEPCDGECGADIVLVVDPAVRLPHTSASDRMNKKWFLPETKAETKAV